MWFENWNIQLKIINKKCRKLRIELPNSATDEKALVLTQGKKLTGRQISQLNGVLGSAFHQIQTDNGGYKKE